MKINKVKFVINKHFITQMFEYCTRNQFWGKNSSDQILKIHDFFFYYSRKIKLNVKIKFNEYNKIAWTQQANESTRNEHIS